MSAKMDEYRNVHARAGTEPALVSHKLMEYPLHFGRQTWKPQSDGELTLFLPSRPRYGTAFHADFTFVPPWVDEEDFEAEYRRMYVSLNGNFPEGMHWDDLEGFTAEVREVEPTSGPAVCTQTDEPEIQIWSSGQGAGSIHTHAQDGWRTRLSLEEFAEGEPHTFICTVEAFFPSARAREVMSELWFQQFFGGEDFTDPEREKLLEEGWRFSYRGRLTLENLSCTVPVNAAPVPFAQAMAARELGMKEFGFCRVNGGALDGSYKPEDGVSESGRLVVLSPTSEFFKQWQKDETERKKRTEGETGK